MAIKLGTYRRNLSRHAQHFIRDQKLAIKTVSRNTPRASIILTALHLNSDVADLMDAFNSYILGISDIYHVDQTAVREAMVGIGGCIVRLAKLIGTRTPTATKRTKLVGTRTAALLQLSSLTSGLVDEASGLLGQVAMTEQNKEVMLPKQGTKEMRTVRVVDTEKTMEMFTNTIAQMGATLSSVATLYWRLSYDFFNAPPEFLFEEGNNNLIAAMGEEFFAPKAKLGGQAPKKDVSPVAPKGKTKLKGTAVPA